MYSYAEMWAQSSYVLHICILMNAARLCLVDWIYLNTENADMYSKLLVYLFCKFNG